MHEVNQLKVCKGGICPGSGKLWWLWGLKTHSPSELWDACRAPELMCWTRSQFRSGKLKVSQTLFFQKKNSQKWHCSRQNYKWVIFKGLLQVLKADFDHKISSSKNWIETIVLSVAVHHSLENAMITIVSPPFCWQEATSHHQGQKLLYQQLQQPFQHLAGHPPHNHSLLKCENEQKETSGDLSGPRRSGRGSRSSKKPHSPCTTPVSSGRGSSGNGDGLVLVPQQVDGSQCWSMRIWKIMNKRSDFNNF